MKYPVIRFFIYKTENQIEIITIIQFRIITRYLYFSAIIKLKINVLYLPEHIVNAFYCIYYRS